MNISGRLSLSPFEILKTYTPTNTADAPAELGALGSTPDGRTFKLAYNPAGGTTLNPAKLAVGPAVNSYYQGLTISAQAIGDTSITATLSASSNNVVAANYFALGFLGVITGTGIASIYQIKSHPAVTATSTSVKFTLTEPVALATAATDTCNIWAHPCSAPVVCPTTYGASTGGTLVGTPLVALAADATYGTYGWFQIQGVGLAYNIGGTTTGLGLAPTQATTAGALATVAATTCQVAIACQTGTTTAYSFVDWNIA